MLAISERSVVLLINPQIVGAASLPAQFRRRIDNSHALLRHVVRVSGVSMRLLGAVGDAGASFGSLDNCEILPGDPVNFWREKDVIGRLGPPESM